MRVRLEQHITGLLIAQRSSGLVKKTITPVGGGSINEAWCFNMGTKSYFVKTNSAGKYPHMFEREGEGLRLLADTRTFRIPEIIAAGEFEESNGAVLELTADDASGR